MSRKSDGVIRTPYSTPKAALQIVATLEKSSRANDWNSIILLRAEAIFVMIPYNDHHVANGPLRGIPCRCNSASPH